MGHQGRLEKGRTPDEFCQVTGYHRKYALRLLNGPAPATKPARRRRRPKYPAELVRALVPLSSFFQAFRPNGMRYPSLAWWGFLLRG